MRRQPCVLRLRHACALPKPNERLPKTMKLQSFWRDRWMPAMKAAFELTRAGRRVDAELPAQRFERSPMGPQRNRPTHKECIDVPSSEVPQAPEGRPTARSSLQEDDSFTDHAFEHDGTATRNYKLYVPARVDEAYAQAPMALIVMLHGCTQNPDDFATGTAMNAVAKRHGFVVLYPEQSRRANRQRCWNWFFKQHQQRDAGEPGLIAAMTRHIVQTHNLDARRVYVAGLSAGGAMAAILGGTYPDVYAAIGVHSGLPAGAADGVPSALQAMKVGSTPGVLHPPSATETKVAVPTIVFHGDADAVVNPVNGANIIPATDSPTLQRITDRPSSPGQRSSTRLRWVDALGRVQHEHWLVHGGGHAWFGGHAGGSYTDVQGPDASAAMVNFFLAHRLN